MRGGVFAGGTGEAGRGRAGDGGDGVVRFGSQGVKCLEREGGGVQAGKGRGEVDGGYEGEEAEGQVRGCVLAGGVVGCVEVAHLWFGLIWFGGLLEDFLGCVRGSRFRSRWVRDRQP